MVILSSVAAGIGARGFAGTGPINVAWVSMVSLLAWAAWALVIYQIGGRLFLEPQTQVDVGEPGLLRLFSVLPGVTGPAFAVSASGCSPR